ncbi:PAS domain S-box protein [Bacteroidota bacterium]
MIPESNVLVIGDGPGDPKPISQMLKKLGIEVTEASDDTIALETLEKEVFDLILLDSKLPGTDGCDVCRQLKSDKKYSEIPILFLTDQADPQTRSEIFNAGGDDYIPKPYNEDEVLSRVRTHLELYKVKENLNELIAQQTAEIQQSEKRFQYAIEATTDGLYDWNILTNEIYFSPGYFTMLGYEPDELPHTLETLKKLLHPEDAVRSKKRLSEYLSAGKGDASIELRFKSKTGDWTWILSRGKIVEYDDEGKPSRMVGTNVNIDERKKAEEALRESEARYLDLYDNAPDMYVSVDAKTARIRYCNQILSNNTGYTKEEIIGRPVFEMYHPDCMEDVKATFKTFVETGTLHDKELQLMRKDGTKLDVSLNVSSVRDENGNVLYSRSIWRDVTERKQAEEALRFEKERAQQYLDTAGVMLVALDKQQRVVLINPKGCEILGYQEEEILGQNWFDKFLQSENTAEVKQVFDKIISGELKPVEYYENPIVRKDGSQRIIAWHNSILRDSSGEIIGTLSSGDDITQQKKTELRIRTEKEFTNTALDAQLDTFFLFEPSLGKALRWNKSFRDITGYNDEEIAEMPAPASYYSPKDLERASSFIQKVMKEGSGTIEFELICKDGRKVPTEYRVSVINDEYGEPKYIISIGRDITKRKQMEKELHTTQMHYTDFINSSSDSVGYWKMPEGLKTDLPIKKQLEMLYNLVCLDANKVLWKAWKFKSKNEIIGKKLIELVLENTYDQAFTDFIKNNYQLTNYETHDISRSGEINYMLETWYGVVENGVLTYLWANTKIITEQKKTELALRESEEKLCSTVNSMVDLVFVNDLDGRITEFYKPKERGEKFFPGVNFEGNPIDEVLPKEVAKSYRAIMKKAGDEKTVKEIEYTFQYNDELVWHGAKVSPRIDINGNVNGFTWVVRDITSGKTAEEALLLSEEKFSKLFQTSPNVLMISALEDGRIIEINNAGIEAIGLPEEKILGKTSLELGLMGAETREQLLYSIQQQGYYSAIEIPVTLPSGEKRIGLFHGHAITLGDEKYLFQTIVNITDRKRAEASLKQSEEKFRILFESAPDAYYLNDLKGNFIDGNKIAEIVTGYSRKELVGKNMLKLNMLPGNQIFKAAALLAKNVLGKSTGPDEFTLTRKDSSKIEVEISTHPVKIEGKSVVLGIARDITERKRTEEALSESEKKYRSIVENTSDWIWEMDLKGNHTYSNNIGEKILGYPLNKFYEMDPIGLVHPDDRGKFIETYKKAIQNKAGWNNVVLRWCDKDRKYHYFESSAEPRIDYNGNLIGFIGIDRDITDKKIIEKQVLSEKLRAESYLETAAVMMLVLDKKGTVTLINSKGAEILGYSKKYIIGRNWIDNFIPEENRTNIKRILKRLMKGEIEFAEYFENAVLCRYKKIKILGWYNTQIKDKSGKVTGILSSAEDITERVSLRAELESSNKELRSLTEHLQKVREEERTILAREIHDDLGQSLTALKLDLSQLRKKIDPSQIQLTEKVKSALELAGDTVETVKKISTDLRPSIIDDLGLIPAIRWYIGEFMKRSGIKVKLSLEVDEYDISEEIKISIYRILQEALTNVIRHAHASKITIGFQKKGKNLILQVKDNGIGIKERQMHKEKSFGIIGMKERVILIGGQFEISGEKNKGTKIKVVIPVK